MPHKRCAGTGHTVTWTEGIIDRQPQTEDIRWPDAGVSFVARQQAREKGRWSKVTLVDREAVPDGLETEFKKLLLPHLKPSDGEIARKATVRYLPLARVAVSHHSHRVYYVFPGHTALEVLPLPSPRRTWQIAGVVLAALAALYLLVHLIS
ncbi:hypothetical protein GTY73_31025 [Streptomyces sp. SID8354]|nr:hypothetical protein [Streptomyces sp. SID8354]